MPLWVLKYIACQVVTDTAIKTISNNYSCQVLLDKSIKATKYSDQTYAIKIPIYWNFELPADREIERENKNIWQKSVIHAQKCVIENSNILEFCVAVNGKFPQNRTDNKKQGVHKTGQGVEARCPQKWTDGKSAVSTKVDRR